MQVLCLSKLDMYYSLSTETAGALMQALPNHAHFWGSEAELKSELDESMRWEVYKKEILDSVYSDKVKKRIAKA